MTIPLVDLKKQFEEIKFPLIKGVSKILKQGNFILGIEVAEFEKNFAKYLGVEYCVGVASGADALLLSLIALGVKTGDEVITVPNTFIATIFPIISLGAKPILVEIDPKTYQIDSGLIEKAITPKTKVILPVHLFGIPSPMKQILAIAKKRKIKVLEDAAQAHGSSINKKKCGSFGDLAAFSFYPGKNLGAAGDGGAVVTNNKKYADLIRQMRNIGQSKKYVHETYGLNSRLDTIQAIILSTKLKKLNKWNKRRTELAATYNRSLGDLPLILPPKLDSKYKENYHLYVIRTKKRDALLKFLESSRIFCGIHYPIPIHLQNATKFLGYKKGDFPITEEYASQLLSLPLYPHMTNDEINFVCSKIRMFFKE